MTYDELMDEPEEWINFVTDTENLIQEKINEDVRKSNKN